MNKDPYDQREAREEQDGRADDSRHAKRQRFDDDEPYAWHNHKKRDSGKRRHRAKHGHERPALGDDD